MEKGCKNKIISAIITFTMFISFLSTTGVDLAYANDEPDVILYIHGEKSNGGPIFHSKGDMAGNELWAPGVTKSGVLRLYNNYSQRIKVNNLSLRMTLEKLRDGEYVSVTDRQLYELFAKNMKLTIKKGRTLIFTNTIYNKSFLEMLYQKDHEQYKGYDLPIFDRFNIDKGDYIDLEYTVYMDENAGNELQGLKATVDFMINAHENPIYKKTETKDSDDHWAHDCIETLIQKGIIKGYPDGTIRPENYITRAEAAVLIGRALGLEEKDSTFTGYFDSIPNWARGYIISTTQEDIFTGYPGKLFKADNHITREEMMAILMRGFNKTSEGELKLEFDDKDDIGTWALEYIKAGVKNEIIEGYPDGTIKPNNEVTRAEAFTMICKLLGYHEKHIN
ncbi:S-layer homology domain-containing protein [Caldisalinibacter kiritimatiensis]|uniref:SLH domain-containing protein n=1 Tax=Caldisalinibacter kiritimatiensis TaxID=1304284 RepID=R1CYN9_9FIRM|nr:S-layer homology domain-containing protein [Caldisalinibacter kiritimatiensis]EOD01699.1 hypothetical protein L21TH_0240 [Caldisalinibacter kiritimatiensis]